jgi:hypothetical protein
MIFGIATMGASLVGCKNMCPCTPTLLAELSGLENRHRLHPLDWH